MANDRVFAMSFAGTYSLFSNGMMSTAEKRDRRMEK
jgi:hypothetical protein